MQELPEQTQLAEDLQPFVEETLEEFGVSSIQPDEHGFVNP